MWTAKFTSGGFSVNFFWPTPAPENIMKTKSKKKRRKKKPKASNNVTMVPSQPLSSQMTTVVPENLPAAKHVVPLDAPQHDSKVSPVISSNSPQSQATNTSSPAPVLSPSHSKSLDLENCTDVYYESRKGVHGVSYCDAEAGEKGWMPVVGKRRKHGRTPLHVRQRFPKDHPIHQVNPVSDSDSGSDHDLDDVIPSGADVEYKIVDIKPGLSV